MKTLKFAATLYAGILLILLLFPPWSEGYYQVRGADSLYSSLGHHWRLSFPYYWGYQEDECTDRVGRTIGCNGRSIWMPNEHAVIDYRMLRYEAALGLIVTIFLVLIVDLTYAPFALAFSNLLALFRTRFSR